MLVRQVCNCLKFYPSLEARIKENATVQPPTILPTGCWEWNLRLDRDGYGQIGIHGKNWLAHRASYTIFVGPIPDGMQLDHLCRNRRCVNPEHLEPVTQLENGLRGESICVKNMLKNKCVNGHEFTPDNTYIRKGGWRACRICNARSVAAYQKKSAERRRHMSDRPRLTDRQRQLFDFIVEQSRRRGYAPSIREIGKAHGIGSPNGVMCHIHALEEKGYLRREFNTARSITIVGHGGDADYAEAIDLLETVWREHYVGLLAQRHPTAVKIHRHLVEAGKLTEESHERAS